MHALWQDALTYSEWQRAPREVGDWGALGKYYTQRRWTHGVGERVVSCFRGEVARLLTEVLIRILLTYAANRVMALPRMIQQREQGILDMDSPRIGASKDSPKPEPQSPQDKVYFGEGYRFMD